VFCLLVGSQHFQYDLLAHSPKGLVCGLSRDFVPALEGLYFSQLRGRLVVNWGDTAVIAIDVESSFFFFPPKEKKEKFQWGKPNGLPLYDTG